MYGICVSFMLAGVTRGALNRMDGQLRHFNRTNWARAGHLAGAIHYNDIVIQQIKLPSVFGILYDS